MSDQYLDSIQLLAYLSGAWVNIYPDVKTGEGSISANWGIRGIGKFDLLADIGEISFDLMNNTGKYYPDGGAALAGWTRNVPIKLILTYDGDPYQRFKGYVEDIKLHVGKHPNASYVTVRALDWMKFADRFPLTDFATQTDKRADQGIGTVMTPITPATESNSLQHGVYTFPVIFDGGSLRTTAYSEFAKLVNSEVGHLYIRHDPVYGEMLTFTNRNNDTSGVLDAIIVDSDIDDVDMHYGENIVNRATAVAYPKRIDTELQVLYSLNKPMPIKAGETITFRAKYTDPDGGSRVNAIESSMQTPEVPGATDPYLKTLLNFTDGFTDETGLHTWTKHDTTIYNTVYKDGYGTTFIAGNILGQYALFGGYSNYVLTAPSSSDFNFGSGAFTIGWYEDRLNPINATMARDMSTYPAFVFGRITNKKDVKLYMSSGGSEFDIANGRSMGQANVGRWTYYEISRDDDGWFYSFSDGKLVDKWYSPLALRSSSAAFTIGRTKFGFCYFGFDAFFIKKGVCMHKKDFEPPKRSMRPVLDGDYLMNSLEDGTGDDLSAALNITASYASEAVTYTLENTSATDAFIIFLQARGRGVYSYNSIENSVEDATSIADFGHKEEKIDMPYQQDLKAGTEIITELVGQEKDPRTELRAISFVANRSVSAMTNFLNRDVGDLINVVHADSGIDNFYRINNVSFDIIAGGKAIRYKWGLRPQLNVDDIVITPVDPSFKGVIGISDITQSQTFDTVDMTQDYLAELTVTIGDIAQTQTVTFNLPEMSVYLISEGGLGGDVFGDTVPSVAGNIPLYSDTSGKHISDTSTVNVSSSSSQVNINLPAATVTDTAGPHLYFNAGTGNGTGAGGNVAQTGGEATDGDGGDIILYGGASQNGVGGDVLLSGGVGGSGNGVIKFSNPNNGQWSELDLSNITAQRIHTVPDYDGTFAMVEDYRRKIVGTQFDKTNTALADVTDLSVNIVSGETYTFKAVLFTTSNVAGGVKAAINGTSTASSIRYEGFATDAGATTQSRASALGGAVAAVTAVTNALVVIEGVITASGSGSLTVQFAENAAVSTSSVLVGSYFEVMRVM